jgi:hypothetical protein
MMYNRLLLHGRQNVVAYLALFVALGGTSYAAINLPANSVGAKQIKKNAVRAGELKSGAVRTSEVKDFSLLAKDFKTGQLPAGAQGAQGPQGPQGARGPGGPAGPTSTFISGGGPGSTQAFCEAGEVALGGGGTVTDGFLARSQPLPFSVDEPAIGWEVEGKKADGTAAMTSAWVVCAP